MFSKRLCKFLRFLTYIGAKFGVIAGRYNKTTKTFQQDSSLEWKVRANYNLFFIWVAGGWGIILKHYVLKNVNRMNVTIPYSLAGVLSVIVFSSVRWFLHDICLMTNGFTKFIRYIHETYGRSIDPDKSKDNVLLAMFLESLTCLIIFCYVSIVAILIYDSRGLMFLGELVPIQYYYFPVALSLILLQSYLLLVVHIMYLTIFTAILIYGFYFTPILIRELRMGRKKYRLSDEIRKPDTVRHIYRSLQILQTNVFGVLGIFLVMCHGLLMLTIIFCNFVLIKYWAKLQLISRLQLIAWTGIFMSFWGGVLELGRFLFSRGSKVLGSWKKDKHGQVKKDKLMKKFMRSCKPIVLSYGRQFVIGRVSMMIFFRGVVRGTFRALLTTKK